MSNYGKEEGQSVEHSLNHFYGKFGKSYEEKIDAIEDLKERGFKQIKENIYKNSKGKIARLTHLRNRRCRVINNVDAKGKVTKETVLLDTYRSIGWLVTFETGRNPISYKQIRNIGAKE